MDNVNAKLKKTLEKKLALCLLLTFLLPLGIIMTVSGALNMATSKLHTAIMAIGVIFIVLGFYGSPVAWTKFSAQKKYIRVIVAIENEGFRDTTEIAKHLSMPQKDVVEAIRFSIEKQYLTDYTLDGTTILPLNNNCEPSVRSVQCPHCGGITESCEKQVKCQYCGRTIDVENLQNTEK